MLVAVFVLGGLAYHYFNQGLSKGQTALTPDPKNATYAVEDNQITLTNGEVTNNASAASGNSYDALLGNVKTVADVDGDLVPETLVTLTYNSGGSGTFNYLAVLKAGSEVAPTLFVGDRVIIKNITVTGGVITVNYLDRSDNDPMAAEPTQPKTLTTKFVNGQFKNN